MHTHTKMMRGDLVGRVTDGSWWRGLENSSEADDRFMLLEYLHQNTFIADKNMNFTLLVFKLDVTDKRQKATEYTFTRTK